MSVNAAGSAQNVQQAVTALRQTVQAEQVAASALSEVATEAAKQAGQQAAQNDAPPQESSSEEGLGQTVDVTV